MAPSFEYSDLPEVVAPSPTRRQTNRGSRPPPPPPPKPARFRDQAPPKVPPRPSQIQPTSRVPHPRPAPSRPPPLRPVSAIPPSKPRKQGPTPCCVCRQLVKTWNCVQCCDYFCDVCWPLERPHLPGKVGMDGRKHEKVDEEVINRLEQIFVPPSQEEQHQRHTDDINTTWFGVVKEINQLTLTSSNRLVNLLHESQVGDYSERYPHLVSFVGQTGAGKSTVIKMLIDREKSKLGAANQDCIFPGPVPGLVSDSVPTTGDVHLYADPRTYFLEKPILFADCEGLSGGEHAPRGLKAKEMKEGSKRPKTFVKDKLRKKLAWAAGEKQTREYAVTTLFPRILYPFSDVVVFVLREIRTFETKVLQQLIDWAAKSFDKSLNQPNLPHIVIVINATDNNIDESQWDTETATRSLLDEYSESVHQVPALQGILFRLNELHKKIRTTKDLLEYYYSSITVVRIPSKGRYMQMDEQVGKLYNIIATKCAYSHAYKQKIRMLLNAEKLPQYVYAAYDHFSQRLDEPFDFMVEARRHTPLPRDFDDYILNLLRSVYQHQKWTWPSNVRSLFMKLSRPVASCIMLAATRENRRGAYCMLLKTTYSQSLEAAFREFCAQWLRCGYEQDGFQCCNSRNAHKKGHQAQNGKIMARGRYSAPIDTDTFFPEWIAAIDKEIGILNDRLLHNVDRDEKKCIPPMHWDVMEAYYRDLDPGALSRLRSHVTCLGCVHKIPETVLPCGHALCKPCIQSIGNKDEQGSFQIDHCPLHPGRARCSPPVRVRFKPTEAGVRVLCLDGGGVRGMIQLVVLQEIQNALGGYIPIQNFFDLIVGTGTGGIIALGLGVKRWSVSQCESNFKSLCEQAFTKRGPRSLRAITIVSHKSVYKTKPLENALQSAFDDYSYLFGGYKPQGSTDIKVAVTSNLASENKPVLLSNYNTAGKRDESQYKFVRPQHTSTELKIWEAARATAAAPPYFKPFIQDATMAAYRQDEAHRNNPVFIADEERKLIWEETADGPPDIVLSIGTGISRKQTSPVQSTHRLPKPESMSPKSQRHHRSIPGLSHLFWPTTDDAADSQLGYGDGWNGSENSGSVSPGKSRGNESRMDINVRFPGEMPEIDAVEHLDHIERHATNMIRDDPEILEIAHKLVASCFYFEKSGHISQDKETTHFRCTGSIRCRFDEGSQELKGLGCILQNHIRGSTFTPYFFLQENYGSVYQSNHEVPIHDQTIEVMRTRGHFELLTPLSIEGAHESSITRLSLCLRPEDYSYRYQTNTRNGLVKRLLPISGFPKELHAMDHISLPNSEEEDQNGNEVVELPAQMASPGHLSVNSDSEATRRPWLFAGARLPGFRNDSQTSLHSKSSSDKTRQYENRNSSDGASTESSWIRRRSKSTSGSGETRFSTETFNGRSGDRGDELHF